MHFQIIRSGPSVAKYSILLMADVRTRAWFPKVAEEPAGQPGLPTIAECEGETSCEGSVEGADADPVDPVPVPDPNSELTFLRCRKVSNLLVTSMF